MLRLTQMAWGNLKRGNMFLTFSANKVQIFSCYEKHTENGGRECDQITVGQSDCASKGVAVLFTNNFEYKIHILKDDKDQKGVIF